MGDFVWFRAVCTTWNDAAPKSDSPPQLPWIIASRHTSSSKPMARTSHAFCAYSHSSGRMYNLRIGGLSSWILGSGTDQGYIIAIVDLYWKILYNPITRMRWQLPHMPPFISFRHSTFSVLDDGDAGCLVVNTCTEKQYFAFCRPSVDEGWKVFDRSKSMGNNAYSGGRFYANDATCKTTMVISATTLVVEVVVPPPHGENFCSALDDYLVGSNGKLFRVIMHPCSRRHPFSPTNFHFNVYQLDITVVSGTATWTKVESIGNTVLFFDHHGYGFSLEPNEAAGMRRGCIYFIYEEQPWVGTWANRFFWYRQKIEKARHLGKKEPNLFFLCRYNMEEGHVDNTVPLDNEFTDTRLFPSTWYFK